MGFFFRLYFVLLEFFFCGVPEWAFCMGLLKNVLSFCLSISLCVFFCENEAHLPQIFVL